MHPAFSVIFFTTLSGAGFGLLAWLGMLALVGGLPLRATTLQLLLLGAGLAAIGLLSSLAHLGQPQRAWRAFSQWRSSWLSREGVFSVATFAAVLWLGWLVLRGEPVLRGPADDTALQYIGLAPGSLPIVANASVRIAGAVLALLALGSVVCTAMIYASLKPVPAWTHPLVLPVYLVFALFTGGMPVGIAWVGLGEYHLVGFGVAAGALLLWALKARAWRYVDEGRAPVSRNDALGLPHARPVQVFERPHTEANYLLKEMGYVLARKHAKRLRLLAIVLFALLPALLALPLWLLPPFDAVTASLLLAIASASALLGALVERWLFFAEARHLVTLYY